MLQIVSLFNINQLICWLRDSLIYNKNRASQLHPLNWCYTVFLTSNWSKLSGSTADSCSLSSCTLLGHQQERFGLKLTELKFSEPHEHVHSCTHKLSSLHSSLSVSEGLRMGVPKQGLQLWHLNRRQRPTKGRVILYVRNMDSRWSLSLKVRLPVMLLSERREGAERRRGENERRQSGETQGDERIYVRRLYGEEEMDERRQEKGWQAPVTHCTCN